MAINKEYISITNSQVSKNTHLKYLLGCYSIKSIKYESFTYQDKVDLIAQKQGLVPSAPEQYLGYLYTNGSELYIDANEDLNKSLNVGADTDPTFKDSVFLYKVSSFTKIDKSAIKTGDITLQGTDGLYKATVDKSNFIEVAITPSNTLTFNSTNLTLNSNLLYTKEDVAQFGYRLLMSFNLNQSDTISIVDTDNVPTPVQCVVISNNGKFSNYSVIPNTSLSNTTSINNVSQVITTLNINNEFYYHSLLDKSTFSNVQSTSNNTNTASQPYSSVQPSNNNPFLLNNPEAVSIYPIFDIEQEFSSVSNPSEKITVQKRAKSNQGNLFSNPRTEYTITSSVPNFDSDYTTTSDVLVWLPRVSKYILLQNKTLRYKALKGVIYSTNDLIYSDADSNIALMPYSNLNLLDELGYISCLTMFVNKDSTSIGGVPETGELLIKQGTNTSDKPLVKVMDSLSFQANKLPSFQGSDYLNTPLYNSIKGRVDAIDSSQFITFNSSINEVLLGIVKNDSGDVAYGLGSYYIYPKSLTAETDLLIANERASVNDIVMQ